MLLQETIENIIETSKKLGLMQLTNQITIDECRHMQRIQLETIIMEYLITTYFDKFDSFWNNSELIKDANKVVIFVERRPHKYLEFVIKNFHYYLPDWSIEIHGSNDNQQYVKRISGIHSNNVKFVLAFDKDCDKDKARSEYNNYLKSRKLYEGSTAEHIIIAQTDSYLVDKIPESLFEYDFMAGTCYWDKGSAGYGGLSYRKRSAMLKLCDIINPNEIDGEDCYFAEGCVKADLNYCHSFASYFIESLYNDDFFGVHQWWTYIVRYINYTELIQKMLICK